MLVPPASYLLANAHPWLILGEHHPVVTGLPRSTGDTEDIQITSAREALLQCPHSACIISACLKLQDHIQPSPLILTLLVSAVKIMLKSHLDCLLIHCQCGPWMPNHIKTLPGRIIYNKIYTNLLVSGNYATQERAASAQSLRAKQSPACEYKGNYKSANTNVKFGLVIWFHQEQGKNLTVLQGNFATTLEVPAKEYQIFPLSHTHNVRKQRLKALQFSYVF